MAGGKIRVLIVDDHDSTVQTISTLLNLDVDIEVAGTAGDGLAAIESVQRLRPNVVLMDINMPRMDGIAATEVIVANSPETAVVMLSAQTDNDYLRRSMNVGASYFLAKPVSSGELYNAVRRAHEVNRLRLAHVARAVPTPAVAEPPARPQGSILALFSPSGGVGRTTIATNLAVALRRTSNKDVALADLSIPFGDVGVLLNAPPTAGTLADLIGKFADARVADVDRLLFRHGSGVDALLAPPAPETEELIHADDVRKVLDLLREGHDFVVVDTWPSYGDTIVAVLDRADIILLPIRLELTSVKNARVFVEIATKLGLAGKIKLVLNRADEINGLRLADVQTGLGHRVSHSLASDEQALRIAMNRGVPVLDSHAASRLSRDFITMARGLGVALAPAAARSQAAI